MNITGNASATLSTRPPSAMQNLIIMCATLGCISLVGLVGNFLVIAVSRRLRSQDYPATVLAFIFHLALSDLLVCGVCIPLTISTNFVNLDSSSFSSQAACKALRYFQFLPPTLSITILTTVSIDRYFALVKPLSKHGFVRRPGRMVTVAWLYSIIIFLPAVFFVKVIDISGGNFGYCTTVQYNSQSGFGFLMFVAVFSFLLPLTIMFFMYFNIVRVVWFRKKAVSGANSTPSAESVFKRSKKKVLKLFFRVILVFLVCWLPFVLYCGFVEMFVKTFPNPGDIVRITLYFLGLFNSLCNPFVYFFYNRAFRMACVDLIFCRKIRNYQNVPKRPIISSDKIRGLMSSATFTQGRNLTLSSNESTKQVLRGKWRNLHVSSNQQESSTKNSQNAT